MVLANPVLPQYVSQEILRLLQWLRGHRGALSELDHRVLGCVGPGLFCQSVFRGSCQVVLVDELKLKLKIIYNFSFFTMCVR